MVTANIVNCIKAIRLLGDDDLVILRKRGKADEPLQQLRKIMLKNPEVCDLMKDCTPRDLYEACDILEDQALWASKLKEIGERHHAKRQETMRDILTRAAAAGDEDAKALIACGLLEQKRY